MLVRAKGTTFRAKVVDRNDGSYLVVYKPTVAGKCVISVSLNGNALPDSPQTCLVSDALAVAELSMAQGAGLTHATSWQQESFQVSFRDAQGQAAPAAELDVFVRPLAPKEAHANRKGDSRSPLSLNALNGMIIGPKPLPVRSDISPSAPRVGQLMPGTVLRILKLEPLAEEGSLCACVMLSHNEASGQSWRELYAQLPDWRARSWRKHEKEKKANMDVQDALREIEQAEAAAAAKKEAEAEQERKRLELQLQAEQELRAAEEARAREEARIERERRKKEAKKKKEANKEEEKGGKGGKAAKAAKAAKANKGTLPVAGKTMPSSAGMAPTAGLNVGASSRASCLSTSDPQASAMLASAAPATTPSAHGEKQRMLVQDKEPGASRRDVQPALDAAMSVERSYDGNVMEGNAQSESRSALSSAPALPLPAKEQPRYGWVTVAKDGQQCVSNFVEKLEPRERQRMAKHWKHRITISSERERARSLAMDGDKLSRSKGDADSIDIDEMVRSRNAFIQELEMDPRRICFAYGGIHPGRAGAKGRLFNMHTVTYAVGAAGQYELHVCLRRDSSPLPGSPFALVVSPGPAYPMACKLPLPLLGTFELVKSEDGMGNNARCACRVVFQTRDKMGNPCTTGGAHVQVGGGASSGGVQSKCTDLGNGKYDLEFLSDASSGAQEVYVKIDGLHVIGSPTKLRLTSATPDVAKSEVLSISNKVEAGTVTKVRIKCKDSGGNPALGHALLFGVTLISVADKVSEWEHCPASPTRQSAAGEELELCYAPTIAGECKVYLWAVEGGAARRRVGQQQAQARRQSVAALRRSHEGPTGTLATSSPGTVGAPTTSTAGEPGTGAQPASNVARRRNAATLSLSALISDTMERSTTGASEAMRQRRRSMSRDSMAEVEPMLPTPGVGKARKLLAKGKGEPFFAMKVVAGPASCAHSRIDGIMLSTHGNWQHVPLEDGEVKEERTSKPQGIKSLKKGSAAGAKDQERCGLLVGDTIRFMPVILDEFCNAATITDDRLNISISSHSGEEVLRAHQTTIQGHPVYDVRYEIKRRGVHALRILVDGTNVTGSPISWNARLPDKSASGAPTTIAAVANATDPGAESGVVPPPAPSALSGVTTEHAIP